MDNVAGEFKEEAALQVLIADDDPPTRILLRTAITRWGYKTVEAEDGEEAWQMMQTQENYPRILILDWLMPKLDGLTLAERIKNELKDYPYIYIILLTQKGGAPANVIKSLDAGADAFLSKPFDMAELRSRLSVGARIVHYDNQLLDKNKQLEICFAKVEKLDYLLKDFKHKLYLIEASEESNDAMRFNQLKSLVDDFVKTLSDLNIFCPSSS